MILIVLLLIAATLAVAPVARAVDITFRVRMSYQVELGAFDPGSDFVDIAGTSGTVKEVGIFSTMMATPDNVRIIIPNSSIYGQTIKNFSANDTRRVDLKFGIAYGSDIRKAERILYEIAEADSRVEEPSPDPGVVPDRVGQGLVAGEGDTPVAGRHILALLEAERARNHIPLRQGLGDQRRVHDHVAVALAGLGDDRARRRYAAAIQVRLFSIHQSHLIQTTQTTLHRFFQ
mgnify:CR=1 FL=1